MSLSSIQKDYKLIKAYNIIDKISELMTDITSEIVQRLDYEDIKKKKIFQKFIRGEFYQKNQVQNKRKEGRARSQEAPHSYLRMNTISEESSHFNQTPQRIGSKKNLGHNHRVLSEGSGKKQKQIYHDQQMYDDDNQYYDDHHYNNQYQPYPPPYRQRDQNRQSPYGQNDFYQQDQNFYHGSPHQQLTKSKSPPQRNNSSRGGDFSTSQEFQRSQEFSQQNRRQNSQSPGKGQPIKVDNYNRRFPIKEQQQSQEEEELIGHSQLVPANNYYSSYQGSRVFPPYDNDTYYSNQRMKTSQSQQGLNQYQSHPTQARENRWYDGDYDQYNNQYQRSTGSGGRTNSGSNKGRQANNRQPMNYPPPQQSFPPHQYRHPQYQDEIIYNLQQRCGELESQISRVTQNFDDFKQQAYKDKELNKQAILNYEDTISNLKDRLYEMQTREDTLKQENERLKQKINYEQLKLTKLEEDNRDLNSLLEDTKDQLKESKREIMRKEDELQYAKNQQEAQKQKFTQQQIQYDNIISQLRDDKDQLIRDLQGSQSNNKQFMDLQTQQQNIVNENKRLYSEVDDLKMQIKEQNFFIEQQKQDIYSAKHMLIEKSQRESQLHQQLESSYQEIYQLKGLLQRAETQLMNKQEINQPVAIQPIPYGGRSNEDISRTFKTLNQQEQNKKNQQLNNSRVQMNNSYAQEQTYGRRAGNSNERLYSQNSPQNKSLLMNDSRGKIAVQNQMQTTYIIGSENIQESPQNNKRKQMQKQNNQQAQIDAKQISAENNLIFQQLKNRNTITPSNFLAWEVPEQNQKAEKNQNNQNYQQQGQINDQVQRQLNFNASGAGQQNQEQLDKMYKNAKQQLDKDQEYVNQQYRMQQNMNQNPPQQNQQQGRGQNYDRNVNNEYSQLYNNYINDKFKNSPPQNKKNNQSFDQNHLAKGSVDPQQQIQNIENNLMILNIEKDKLKNELQRLEEAKLKNAQNIRRKNDINEEIQLLDGNISQLKTKLRELNALHPY
ncbi:hypothetical protein ABPG72_010400 [Tetrahymena utriculariae]